MASYKEHRNLVKSVTSIFSSLSGETSSSGARSLFIRCKGCNLRCSYCDTSYSWEIQPLNLVDLEKEVPPLFEKYKYRYVILTGGEPLLQFSTTDIMRLYDICFNFNHDVILQIETNGSINIPTSIRIRAQSKIQYIMDIKLPSSGMFKNMRFENLHKLSKYDELKFVVADQNDLDTALQLCKDYKIKCQNIWFSPVAGKCDLQWLWNTIVTIPDPRFRLQMQIHKVVFPNTTQEV